MKILDSRWAQWAHKFFSPTGAGRRPVMEHWLFVAALRSAFDDPVIAGRIYQLIDERTKQAMLDIKKLQTDMADLKAKVATDEAREATDVTSLSATIADLKAKLAAGEPLTQADLDALDAQALDIGTHVDAMTANLDAAVAATEPPPAA